MLGLYEDFGGKVKGLGGGESISSRERRKNRSRAKSKANASALSQKKVKKCYKTRLISVLRNGFSFGFLRFFEIALYF